MSEALRFFCDVVSFFVFVCGRTDERTDEGTPGKGMLAGLRLRRGLASRTPEIC